MRAFADDNAYLSISGLSVAYGSTRVLHDISLTIRRGEMVALLGASGCGKTTLLRALSGFIEIAGGRILVDGRDLSRVPPERRNMAMMFQSYALWPHMTVRQNIAYGLRLRGHSRADIRKRVDEILDMLGLSEFGERMVDRLSGGQRQRVALGRALAIEPQILLLDEPLSNLDTKIRQQVRHDLKAIQQRLGITAVLVTHDREEAMILADRLVVLQDGRVAQVGTPEEVFCRPATAFVADFMGADNALDLVAERQGDGVILRHLSTGATTQVSAHPEIVSGPLRALFRAESAQLAALGSPPGEGLLLPGEIRQRTYPGGVFRYVVLSGGNTFLIDDAATYEVGSAIGVFLPLSALHLFPAVPSAAAAPPAPSGSPSPTSSPSKEDSSCASHV